jgi:hypothetical protein
MVLRPKRLIGRNRAPAGAAIPRPTRLSVRLDTPRAAARGSSEPRSVNAQDERRGVCPRPDRREDRHCIRARQHADRAEALPLTRHGALARAANACWNATVDDL